MNWETVTVTATKRRVIRNGNKFYLLVTENPVTGRADWSVAHDTIERPVISRGSADSLLAAESDAEDTATWWGAVFN